MTRAYLPAPPPEVLDWELHVNGKGSVCPDYPGFIAKCLTALAHQEGGNSMPMLCLATTVYQIASRYVPVRPTDQDRRQGTGRS